MLRAWPVFALLISACNPSQRILGKDAPRPADASFDAPPPPQPTVDAGPPPAMACDGADAGMCTLPPSTCLDSNYLVYYTNGTCVAGMCEFTTNMLYCPNSCMSGGCVMGGFT